jgi:DNA-directed RNA polymerase subunit H (RpoH/RPB5)
MPEATTGSTRAIYKSRKNLLDILKTRGFDVGPYAGASMNEVNTMAATKQLDMLVALEDPGQKVYVKYHLAKGLRQNNVHEYIEELFQVDQVLKKSDDLIIIVKDEPNDSLVKVLRNIWEQEGYFVTVVPLSRLQFNILQHELVPPHRKLSDQDAEAVRQQFNITRDSEVPDISRFSPVSQMIGLRPGEMCEIMRPSKTGILAPFYRICSS